jgi:hypothetical protein
MKTSLFLGDITEGQLNGPKQGNSRNRCTFPFVRVKGICFTPATHAIQSAQPKLKVAEEISEKLNMKVGCPSVRGLVNDFF